MVTYWHEISFMDNSALESGVVSLAHAAAPVGDTDLANMAQHTHATVREAALANRDDAMRATLH